MAYINGGSKLQCPNCNRLQAFERDILETSLPITVRCSFRDCKYVQSYSTEEKERPPVFPKYDPIHRVHGNWVIEMQSAKDYWKPVDGQVSFKDRCNSIAGNVAMALQTIATLRSDLDQLEEKMQEQILAEWGMLSSLVRIWNPASVQEFIRSPFLSIPVAAQDELVTARTRLLLHPNFFPVEIGIPVKTHGGINAQLLTPFVYASFPVEVWMHALMETKAPPRLRVTGDKIIGRDLFYAWAGIPGTVTDDDHLPEAPSIRIQDQVEARAWLIKNAIRPWGVPPLTEETAYKAGWRYFESQENSILPHHRKAWKRFVEYGRLALFFESNWEAWEFAASASSYIMGKKLCITSSPEKQAATLESSKEARRVSSGSSLSGFQWNVADKPEAFADLPYDAFKLVIVDYQNMPIECLESLYGYKGRLILIGYDPIMDSLDDTYEASLFYGLVADTIIHPGVSCTRRDGGFPVENLVAGLLAAWAETAR